MKKTLVMSLVALGACTPTEQTNWKAMTLGFLIQGVPSIQRIQKILKTQKTLKIQKTPRHPRHRRATHYRTRRYLGCAKRATHI